MWSIAWPVGVGTLSYFASVIRLMSTAYYLTLVSCFLLSLYLYTIFTMLSPDMQQ
jgi:hypothetical protein